MGVGILRGRAFRWRVDGVSEGHLQGSKALKGFSSRPRVVKSFNRYWDDWYLQMDRQDCGAFLENSGRAVDGALAFRIQDENAAMTQAKGAGSHRRHQVCVGIEHDNTQHAGYAAHERGAEYVAGSNGEQVLEHGLRQHAAHDEGIDIALVVGREDEGPIDREL